MLYFDYFLHISFLFSIFALIKILYMTQKELFKPQRRIVKHFIKFLLKQGIYDIYNANLYMFMTRHPRIMRRYIEENAIEYCKKYKKDMLANVVPDAIIDKTLHWSYTDEGHTYWMIKSDRWETYCRHHNLPKHNYYLRTPKE